MKKHCFAVKQFHTNGGKIMLGVFKRQSGKDQILSRSESRNPTLKCSLDKKLIEIKDIETLFL